MDKGDIFKEVQDKLRDVPLFLVGTGGSIPYGLPGMKRLAEHLETSLTPKYRGVAQWSDFLERLANGDDLETALTGLLLSSDVREDIIRATWELVTKDDLKLFEDLILKKKSLSAFSGLLRYFYSPTPRNINIITSNYDRVIEYACDFAELPLDKRFGGLYCGYAANREMRREKIVNILKVHGSLDMFQDVANKQVISVPLQHEIPNGFMPCIITPGSEKYRTILQDPISSIFQEAMALMNQAAGYLCIGYGFNDEQIQTNIIKGIQRGKPIVVATMEISDQAMGLVINNSRNYAVLVKGQDRDTTRFMSSNGNIDCSVDGTYWTMEGLLSILKGA